MKTFQVYLLAAVMMLAVNANAQMKAEKLANPKWYRMTMFKFKLDQFETAKAFVRKNFVPVDKELGRRPIDFETPFGPWDIIVFFPLEGVSELDYKVSPLDEKWLTTLTKQQGGPENVQKLFREWAALIEKTESALVRQSD